MIIFFFHQNVAIFDITEPNEAIGQLNSELPNKTVLFHNVDVRNKTKIESAFKKVFNVFGYVDVLANFAGILDEKKPQDVIDINLVRFLFFLLAFQAKYCIIRISMCYRLVSFMQQWLELII